MNKKTLSEADICAKFITPALMKAGWSEVEQVFREYTLRPGRVVVQGSQSRRDKRSVLRADYALFYKTGMALAVIEAKDNAHAVGAGIQQAIGYAELLSVPFSFSSNGDGFVFRDATLASGTLEATIGLDEFPSPAELWDRYCAWKGWTPARQLSLVSAGNRPKAVGGNFSVERPVHRWKRSFAKHDPKAEPDDSGRSRVAAANKDNFEGERLHLEFAN